MSKTTKQPAKEEALLPKDIERALRELEKIQDIFFTFSRIARNQDDETVNFTIDQLEILGAAIGGAVITIGGDLENMIESGEITLKTET